MSDHDRELALLRVLSGVAWADGVLQDEELSFLRGLAVEYGLSESETLRFEQSLETPVSLEDYERFVNEFRQIAGSKEDTEVLLSRVERLVDSDKSKDLAELRYLHLLREWLAESKEAPSSDSVPLLGRLKGLLRRKGSVRVGSAAQSLVGKGGAVDERQAYVTLFGTLVYRVVYSDQVVEASEAEKLRDLLRERFGFAAAEVDYALRLIQQRAAGDLDRQRLCAEFNRVTGPEERLSLLEACFEMARADGEVTPDEEKEIRLIANYMWVEMPDFVSVRKRVLGR